TCVSSNETQGEFLRYRVEKHSGVKPVQLLALTQELKQGFLSELSILEELERDVQMEQQYISCVVEGMQEQRLIICPLCHMNNLNINSHFVSCCCGLYINTQDQNITPDLLQSLLEARVSEHMEDCVQNPVFSVAPPTDGSPSLMISCKVRSCIM
ncbi:RPA-interacting protein, partial [Notothenia coriiceps]|uniref:RPA-interacting protein n=1 Tax=Notothenia coriiceps TaxID=8208 RepID=A0A6I9NCQ8_9TELE